MRVEEKLQELRQRLVGKTITAVNSTGDGWIIRDYEPARSLNDILFRFSDGSTVTVSPEADGGVIVGVEP